MRFHFQLDATATGAAKPDAAPYLAAAHLARVSDLRSILHVGDSLENDVRGAKALGIQSVLLSRPGLTNTEKHNEDITCNDAEIKIQSLWELEGKIDSALSFGAQVTSHL